MSRSVVALGFVALLTLGLFGALSNFSNASVSADRFGEPPEQLIQFDEQATAAFNDSATARKNRDLVLTVVSIAIGLTGVIVVGVGHLESRSISEG